MEQVNHLSLLVVQGEVFVAASVSFPVCEGLTALQTVREAEGLSSCYVTGNNYLLRVCVLYDSDTVHVRSDHCISLSPTTMSKIGYVGSGWAIALMRTAKNKNTQKGANECCESAAVTQV